MFFLFVFFLKLFIYDLGTDFKVVFMRPFYVILLVFFLYRNLTWQFPNWRTVMLAFNGKSSKVLNIKK